MKTTNAYVIIWCSTGLESVIPIGQYELIDRENTFRILSDADPLSNPLNHIISTSVIRARYNSQRHYEIYAIEAHDGITERDIETMFENNPQASADLVRNIGHKIYSDRINAKQRVIE